MTAPRIRPLLAAMAVAAVLPHGLSGHGLPQMTQDGMAGAAAGLCLVLTAALVITAAPRPHAQARSFVTDEGPTYVGPSLRPSLDRRARASPSALQRFRN